MFVRNAFGGVTTEGDVETSRNSYHKTIYAGVHTKSVSWDLSCRGVLHTTLPYPRGFSSICSVTQQADLVSSVGHKEGRYSVEGVCNTPLQSVDFSTFLVSAA